MVKASTRWLGRGYLVLTLLASVTFFGRQQGIAGQASSARLNRDLQIGIPMLTRATRLSAPSPSPWRRTR